jgi:hypothetical protein
LSDRTVAAQHQQHGKRIRQRMEQIQAVDFFNLLTGPQLLQTTEAHVPQYRERLYGPTETLALFLKQSLEADHCCQKAVNGWAAQRAAEGLEGQSIATGGYCRARKRLPLELVRALAMQTGRELSSQGKQLWHWRDRAVKLADGTCISMPDTAKNQACYPQHLNQAPGVGFPLARLTGVICLCSGAVLGAAMGPHIGPGAGEINLFHKLWHTLGAGDVLIGDALYSDYFTIATLQGMGVDFVFEQHGTRRTDFRRGTALGPREHVVSWPRPRTKPQWMGWEEFYAHPRHVQVREVRVDGRILVTSMLNEKEVSKHELSQLYAYRWNVELDLRNIKTTLGMDILRCRSPEMVEKELWVGLLAYNMIRVLMAEGAQQAGVHPRDLSFKHALQMWTSWPTHILSTDPQQRSLFFTLLAQVRVGKRPKRCEPRAKKRRGKPFPVLTVPRDRYRAKMRAQAHRCAA